MPPGENHMPSLPEWLESKYQDWVKGQPEKQSYYTFARYLDVAHSVFTQWASGVARPSEEDLAKLAGKLGPEVYDLVEMPRPGGAPGLPADFLYLPAAFQSRLLSAIQETGQSIRLEKLDPESVEAKRRALRIFEKWGFKLTG
jgi:hypothetical protein